MSLSRTKQPLSLQRYLITHPKTTNVILLQNNWIAKCRDSEFLNLRSGSKCLQGYSCDKWTRIRDAACTSLFPARISFREVHPTFRDLMPTWSVF